MGLSGYKLVPSRYLEFPEDSRNVGLIGEVRQHFQLQGGRKGAGGASGLLCFHLFLIFIHLGASGLSCGTAGLVALWHVGS